MKGKINVWFEKNIPNISKFKNKENTWYIRGIYEKSVWVNTPLMRLAGVRDGEWITSYIFIIEEYNKDDINSKICLAWSEYPMRIDEKIND